MSIFKVVNPQDNPNEGRNKINYNFSLLSLSGTGSQSLVIGAPITGGTPTQVLYTDNSGNFYSDAGFTRDSVTNETVLENNQDPNNSISFNIGGAVTGGTLTVVDNTRNFTNFVGAVNNSPNTPNSSIFYFRNNNTGDISVISTTQNNGLPLAYMEAALNSGEMSQIKLYSSGITLNVSGTSFNLMSQDGNMGDAVITDGSGNLSFKPISALTSVVTIGELVSGGTPGQILYVDGLGNLYSDSGLSRNEIITNQISGVTISGGTFYSGSTPLTTIINNIASQYSGITGNYLPLSGGTVTGNTTISGTNSNQQFGINVGDTPFGINVGDAPFGITGVTGVSLSYTNITGNSTSASVIAGEISLHNVNYLGGILVSSLSGTSFIGGTTTSSNLNFSDSDGYGGGVNGTQSSGRLQYNMGAVSNQIAITSGGCEWNFSGNTIMNLPTSGGTSGQGMILDAFGNLYFNNLIQGVTPGTNLQLQVSPIFHPTIGMVSSPSVNGFTFSGAASGNTFSANTISGGTFYSGSTPLTTIINNIASQYSGVTGNFLSISGGTVTGSTTFGGGLYGNASGLTAVSETNIVSQYSGLTASTSANTFDVSQFRTAKVYLQNNSNLNVNLSNLFAGNSGNIILQQGTSGNSTVTLTGTSYNNHVVNGGSGVINLTQAANAIDIVSFLTDGTNVYWSTGYNYL